LGEEGEGASLLVEWHLARIKDPQERKDSPFIFPSSSKTITVMA
jgi:hypothetical protein